MLRTLLLSLAFILFAGQALGQDRPPPAAVVADSPRDLAHPPQLLQVRYATGGHEVPARFFVAAGAGAHPSVLLLHGLPGTELNLDLARAMQRAGWNVLAIHYRGVWGAPGQYSLSHTVEDARAALDWLRAPERASLVDASRLVVLGHSAGGFDTVMIGDDAQVAGFVTISAWDALYDAARITTPQTFAAAEAALAEELSFTNLSFAAMVEDISAHAEAWNWEENAAQMAGRPVLVIDSDDGYARGGDAIVAAVTKAGGPAPTRLRFKTDHSYNDQRIGLASAVLDWLEANFP